MGCPAPLAEELVVVLESDAPNLAKWLAAWSALENKVIGAESLAAWLKARGYDMGGAHRDGGS